MPAKTLMIQGTTSDAGKSTIAAGLCRAFARGGLRVAPFKPQNMALNSAVTCDGGEIGRAQALQAIACGIAPHTDMNPVLLKPSTETGAQVIVQGRVWKQMDARTFHAHKSELMPRILESFHRLSVMHDRIVVEGAGSPAEVNLRDNDLANMGFAEAVDCPVIIVADIDRGGVFAHIAGTMATFSDSERRRVKGFIINRFRGDASLLTPGIEWLETTTGVPTLGVMPYMTGLTLDPEDSLSGFGLTQPGAQKYAGGKQGELQSFKVVIPRLPRLSNETDFLPLAIMPGLSVEFIGAGQPIPPADLVILPGSKSVAGDLLWLRQNGWEVYINRHLRYGGKLIGICGGFQMLGEFIKDPSGVESEAGGADVEGLGLLQMTTTMQPAKVLQNVCGSLLLPGFPETVISGYEIHMGLSEGESLLSAPIRLDGKRDGAVSDDNAIFGTYIHGLFDQSAAADCILRWAGFMKTDNRDFLQERERSLDALAAAINEHLNMAEIERILSP